MELILKLWINSSRRHTECLSSKDSMHNSITAFKDILAKLMVTGGNLIFKHAVYIRKKINLWFLGSRVTFSHYLWWKTFFVACSTFLITSSSCQRLQIPFFFKIITKSSFKANYTSCKFFIHRFFIVNWNKENQQSVIWHRVALRNWFRLKD